MKKLGKAALAVLKGIAPLAASAIGGPFAGPALAILSQTLGVKDGEIEDYILSASPDQLLELKKADMQFKQWMRDADIREDQLIVEDRSNARQLGKDRGLFVQGSLTFLFIVGYFAMVFHFISSDAPQNPSEFAKGQLGVLIGILTAAIPQILAYWFGSSRGSSKKTEMMASEAASNGH